MNIVFKLPNLLSHYFQHCRLNPDLSFIEFLDQHYGGDDGTSADDHEDNKLPYHNHLQANSFNIVFASMPKTEIVVMGSDEKSIEYGIRLFSGNSSEHVLMILQPPRLA